MPWLDSVLPIAGSFRRTNEIIQRVSKLQVTNLLCKKLLKTNNKSKTRNKVSCSYSSKEGTPLKMMMTAQQILPVTFFLIFD